MKRDAREPLLLLFALLAVAVAALAFANRNDESADASFDSGDTGEAASLPTTQPLPTPAPEPTAVPRSSTVQVSYSPTAISVSGVVPAAAVLEGLRSSAAELVGVDAVTVEVEVDEATSLEGASLVLVGEIDDRSTRATVIAAFADLGLTIDDQLTVAGADRTVADILVADERLSQFADFVAAAGLTDEFAAASEEGITLFAPSNRALESLDAIALDDLSDPALLTALLRFHVVEGRFRVVDLEAGSTLVTSQGESVGVAAADGAPVIDDALVVGPDLIATNGVVHVIDRVLLPGTLRTEVRLNEIVGRNPVRFGSGSADIVDDSLAILDRVVRVLLDNPEGTVEVEGHTDTEGERGVNRRLSQQRADAVVDYLVSQGVAADRLVAVGYGESRPLVDPEETDADRRINRRIEFRVRQEE